MPRLQRREQPFAEPADEKRAGDGALDDARRLHPGRPQGADEWTNDQLKGGAKAFHELQQAAAGRYGEKTLRASLQRIGAEKFQLPGKTHGGWYWRLQAGRSDQNGESDNSPLHGSLSDTGKVREVTVTSRELTESPVPDVVADDVRHLVTFPSPPYRESDQVRQVPEFAEPLDPTGTDDGWEVF